MFETILPLVVILVSAWVARRVNKRAREARSQNQATPRAARLLERIQAQQAAAQPTLQGQYTQPASGEGPPVLLTTNQSGRAPSSAQVAAVFEKLMQAGRQAAGPGQYAAPGQYQPSQPATWQPPPPPAHIGREFTGHRPVQNKVPTPNGEIEKRVREMMSTGNEVGAVRLLCDEQDMGIIEAQEYARSLIRAAPANRSTGSERSESASSDARDEEPRYVGSAAFAESVFTTDPDENVWASGWVEKPDVDDRTDIDELWQTVKNQGRPTPS
ncbi:hypothetical protein [Kribbella sp.]|uniref:hypothetical protein n=1 Tax=Kribbella sp. TaxID=1871183 RepID=UPI002D7A2198|nr:hypothetical protein [Kribbella sp.]